MDDQNKSITKERRIWTHMVVIDTGGGRTSVEKIAHWNASGEIVSVIELRDDDPDIDAILDAIDKPISQEINEHTYENAATWIRNVMAARCHTGGLTKK